MVVFGENSSRSPAARNWRRRNSSPDSRLPRASGLNFPRRPPSNRLLNNASKATRNLGRFGNWLKTPILMAALVALIGVVAAAFGGANGMLLALALGGVMNIFAYWFSDKMVLSMYNAHEVDAASAPQFYSVVRELSRSEERRVGKEC